MNQVELGLQDGLSSFCGSVAHLKVQQSDFLEDLIVLLNLRPNTYQKSLNTLKLVGNIAALLQHQPRIELTYAVNVKSLLGQLDVAVVGYGHAEGCGRSGECLDLSMNQKPCGQAAFRR